VDQVTAVTEAGGLDRHDLMHPRSLLPCASRSASDS
jgi:hypothetical protein